MHLLVVTLFAGHGRTLVSSCWACRSVMLGACVCWSTHGAMLLGGRLLHEFLSICPPTQHGAGVAAATSPGSMAEMPNFQPHPDLLNQSVQQNKTPRDSCAHNRQRSPTLIQEGVLVSSTQSTTHGLQLENVKVKPTDGGEPAVCKEVRYKSWFRIIHSCSVSWGPMYRTCGKLVRNVLCVYM